jgi:hypothetical protein
MTRQEMLQQTEEPMSRKAKAWADRVDVQCCATTQPPSVYVLSYRGNAGGRCKRRATHTNGTAHYCTQHAKEPPTVYRKASGKIRADLRPITSDN